MPEPWPRRPADLSTMCGPRVVVHVGSRSMVGIRILAEQHGNERLQIVEIDVPVACACPVWQAMCCLADRIVLYER